MFWVKTEDFKLRASMGLLTELEAEQFYLELYDHVLIHKTLEWRPNLLNPEEPGGNHAGIGASVPLELWFI